MKKSILLVLFTFVNILIYFFFFSDFGYFEYKDKLKIKQNLEQEVETLTKENKILEEKLLRESFSKEKFQVFIFKFEDQSLDTKANPVLIEFWIEKKHYLFLYIFFMMVGYIYIFFLKKLTKRKIKMG
ncbi:MAG: hypothetical protein ACK4UJ_09330 [Leptonema sp. (in: bacteria)]